MQTFDGEQNNNNKMRKLGTFSYPHKSCFAKNYLIKFALRMLLKSIKQVYQGFGSVEVVGTWVAQIVVIIKLHLIS